MTEEMERLRYPIGPPDLQPELSRDERERMLRTLEDLPRSVRDGVDGWTDPQLDTPYRPGGWTVRQVVHHLPDSHLNAYVRFKLAVTEENPTIRPYDEKAWAEQPDARTGAVESSLVLLEGLHRRWVAWLHLLPEAAWTRTLLHPESGSMNLNQLLCLYAWHSEHHLAHVTRLREREGW